MKSFIDAYFATAAPNTLAALASATAAWWLWRYLRPASADDPAAPLLLVNGTAVIVVIVVSLLVAGAAMFEMAVDMSSGTLGIISGVLAAQFMRRGAPH